MNFAVVQPSADVWDRFVVSKGGSLLQLSSWGELKSSFGWQTEIVGLEANGEIVGGALVLIRSLPLHLGSIAYVPKGPVVDWHDSDAVSLLVKALDSVARRHRAALLKVEPDEENGSAIHQILIQNSFRESKHSIQPPNTIIIDLNGTDEQILARMNQGTRRKIRTAAKSQIEVRLSTMDDTESYSQLAEITGERDGFGVHSQAYYRAAFELFAPDHAALLMASYEGKDVAGLMVFALGDTAWYLYGASSTEGRERMPNYALQWKAIEWARERGCKRYDLWGIPDASEPELEAGFQTRRNGLWGVYGFKRGFGGHVWRSVGAWDRVYNPLLYLAYSTLVGPRD